MWGDEVTVERGREKQRQWIFRYPGEQWWSGNIEPLFRMNECKVSQMMTGYFMGRKYGLFLPVYRDPESRGGGVTSRSLITVMEEYFLDTWDEVKRVNEGEELYLIIDNARRHSPLKR